MREVAFIKQNKEKWLGIEQVMNGKVKKNPDEISSLYINLVNDLSFAQTYYPRSNTTVYLNHLSVQVFQRIYKTRRTERNRMVYFFKTEVPLLVYQYRRFLLYAFLFFIVFTLIGLVSAIYDPNFARQILGDDYVNMTMENIKKGNAVGVYGQGTNWAMAVTIITNNLFVSAKTYITGVFFGTGTLFSLMQNSIMLGSFQYFFEQHGALKQSARGIWMHGAFEISSIIVVSMAGLILGASVLFPRTLSRRDAFRHGFRDSFKIFLSVVPFIIMAGLLEGFVTRFALQMPLALNLSIIFGTFAIILYYYAVYPHIVHQKSLKNYDATL